MLRLCACCFTRGVSRLGFSLGPDSLSCVVNWCGLLTGGGSRSCSVCPSAGSPLAALMRTRAAAVVAPRGSLGLAGCPWFWGGSKLPGRWIGMLMHAWLLPFVLFSCVTVFGTGSDSAEPSLCWDGVPIELWCGGCVQLVNGVGRPR